MENIGQAFVTAPDTYVVPANGTTGHMALIPGVSSTNVAEEEKLACFTNSRGVYNKYLGLWEAPKSRVWNGHMWAPLPRKRSATTAAPVVTRRVTTARSDKVAKVNMAVAAQDDSEEEVDDDQEVETDDASPPPKKPKLAARRPNAVTRQVKAVNVPRATEVLAAPRRFGEVKCYACNQLGHIARECPDDDARARNDEYLAKRYQDMKAQGNEDRAA
ncbi:hypothetical protein PR002_g23164 [Phytophthora rubi]|nr:hypothetical protein PR002_g23164 [Phytophthora rubi]